MTVGVCRWEHTPEWTYTSKLLISKHQQVQLLQAAKVLVGMNQDATATEGTIKSSESDQSSASPAASVSFGVREDDEYISSAETTPPPMNEHYVMVEDIDYGRSNGHSGNSSSFSRSYQSAPSSSLPIGNKISHYPQHQSPSSPGLISADDEDEASLVAAVESLCSFSNPRGGVVQTPYDAPPVPPMPAKYRDYNTGRLPDSLKQIPEMVMPDPSHQPLSRERDMTMGNRHVVSSHEGHEYDDRPLSHGRSDDEEDGVFGAMEGVTHHRLPLA